MCISDCLCFFKGPLLIQQYFIKALKLKNQVLCMRMQRRVNSSQREQQVHMAGSWLAVRGEETSGK